MKDDNIKERRQQVRLPIKKEMVIDNAVKGYALDISEGGMFIYTHVPFPKGRLINLNFILWERDAPFNMQARVQSVQEGVGIGVIFTNPSQTDMERLKRFIAENLDAHPLGEEAAASDTRKKVLIVDDSPTARNTYKNKLALAGFVVREASSGVEAIKALSNEKVDLIVLDFQMQGMDGAKFLQLVRANDEWKTIKVIVLSGRITTQEAERVSCFGVADLMSKMTTTPNKLAERIKELLG